MLSSIFNLTNTTIGAGVLTLPYAVSKTGLAVGVIFLCVVAFVAMTSHKLLLRIADRTNSFVYRDLVNHYYGESRGNLMDYVILFYTSGTLIAYPIIIGNNMPDVFEEWIGGDNILGDRLFIMCIVMLLIVLPISLLPNLDPLKHVSAFAMLCVGYVILVVTSYSLKGTDQQDEFEIKWFPDSTDLFLAFPLMSVSFTAHYNVLRIYYELQDRTNARMSRVVNVSIVCTLVAYATMAIVGYLGWRDDTEDDILTNLDESLIPASLARFAICWTIIFSYPLVHFANRASFMNILYRGEKVIPYKKQAMLTLFIIPVSLILAYYLDAISVVFSFSGSTAGVAIVYVVPALLAIKGSGKTWKDRENWDATGVLVFGIVFGCLGFSVAMINVLSDDDDDSSSQAPARAASFALSKFFSG
eukprot:TRINITY_DN7781_c0_g1_i1.p1 TRINITY_DN7781_c0_g1~~TRINITY_DN7781_c0_g1_i1.p1  ORF type:complete len:415 (-),score=112.65 TRINITY_DN7781_c0_g1_i1:68-1312(-)